MTIKTASVTADGQHLRLIGTTGSGHQVVMDDSADDTGPRPSELIPLALAGCTAMDVISILRKKRQEITRYEVHATGVQLDEPPALFSRIDVEHVIEGPNVDLEAVRRAIELSATRYCAVGSTLSTGVTEIHHGYVVRDGRGGRVTGDVVVLGPSGRVEVEAPAVPA
jgi:putative redox protein